jgi:hypothetical protein
VGTAGRCEVVVRWCKVVVRLWITLWEKRREGELARGARVASRGGMVGERVQ